MSERTRDVRILQFCKETVWAIYKPTLMAICTIVDRHKAGIRLTSEEIEEAVGPRGKPSQVSSGGGIAVIPLWGILVPHGGMMVDVSTPGTGLDSWLRQFQEAVDDPNVSAIVLDINSPGGSAQGVSETAAAVRKARAQKPVVAVSNYLTASAAYAVAAQATTLVASPSSLVGSIGTYWIHEDQSEAIAAEGIKLTVVEAPVDGFKTETAPFGPLSDEALQHQQEMVNSFYSAFVDDVAKGRGIDASTVQASYGQGRLLTAPAALACGMVDGIASLDDVVTRLLAGQPSVKGAKALSPAGATLGAAVADASLGFVGASVISGTFDVTAGASGVASFGPGLLDPQTMMLHLNLGPVEGPIPARSTDVDDEPWDAGEQLKKLPSKQAPLVEMHAWVDSSADPDLKGSYKFPHHMVSDPGGVAGDGDETVGAANVNGVRNALARVTDAEIPEGDKAGVRAHLQRHLDDYDKPAASQAATPAIPAATTPIPEGGNTMEPVSTARPPTLEELAAQKETLEAQQRDLDRTAAGRMMTAEEQAEFDELDGQIDVLNATMANIRDRQTRIAGKASDPDNRVSGDGNKAAGGLQVMGTGSRNIPENVFDLGAYRNHASGVEQLASKLTDGARFVNEKIVRYEARDDDAVKSRVDALLKISQEQAADPTSFAHRILVTASPEYDEAFGRSIMRKPLSQRQEQLIRSAVTVTGLGNETPIPITIDPTVLLASDGATNPFRRLAKVVTITGNTYRGLSTQGVTWAYDAEAAAIDDSTPTYDGSDVPVHRARCEVRFSIEVDQDWGGLRAELAEIVNDAKDVTEADKFSNGTGTAEPQGLIWKLNDEGSSVVTTASVNTLALTDVEEVADEMPPRFDASSSWVATKAFYSSIRGLAGEEGRIDVWVPLSQGFASPGNGSLPYTLLGYGASAASEMSKAFTTGGENVAVLGDYQRGFTIIDRVGMNVELDPLVRDGNGKLTGERALFFYARNNSFVRAVNAFRMLQILHS